MESPEYLDRIRQAATGRLLKATISGAPAPKERPRFANGRAYTPVSTKKAEAHLASEWRKAGMPVHTVGARPFWLYVDFFMPKHGKPDVDNLVKLVLDGLNGVAYEDDRQCMGVTARKFEPDRYVWDDTTRHARQRKSTDKFFYNGQVWFPSTVIAIKALDSYAWDSPEAVLAGRERAKRLLDQQLGMGEAA